MNKTLSIGGAIVFLLAGGVWWSKSLESNDPNIVATGGIHWHPQLEIYVKGEKQNIPQNIGLGAVHQPVHTHEDLPLLHLEFSGRVTKDDIRLGNFFRNWGKDMNEFGTNMKMAVNGKENMEFGDYVMRDKDQIELNFD